MVSPCDTLMLRPSASPVLAASVKFPKGKIQSTIQEKELAPNLKGKTWTEGWSLWTWNRKGWAVYAVFMASKVHPWVGVRTGVQLSIRSPKGKIFHKLVEFDKRAFKGHKSKMRVRIKGHYFLGTQQRGKLRIRFGKTKCTLRYKRVLPGLRQFGGMVRIGSQKFLNLPFAPRVQVSGTIHFKGRKVVFQQANGYADRSWQSAPHQVARRWLNVRAFGKKYTILATHLIPTKGFSPQSIATLSIARGQDWIFHGSHRKVQFKVLKSYRDKKNGYRVPTAVSFKGRLSKTRRFHLKVEKVKRYQRLDVLAHLHGFLRFFVKKLITNPFVYRDQVKATLSIYEKGKLLEKKSLFALTESVFLNH